MVSIGRQYEKLYRIVEGSLLTAVRNELPNEVIEEACVRAGYEYRRRLLTPVTMCLSLIACALNREASFAAVWQMLWTELAKEFAELARRPYDSSLTCHARQRLPREVVEDVFGYVREKALIEGKGYERWRGKRLMMLDGSTTRTERTDCLERRYGVPGDKDASSYFPVMRWAALIAAGTGVVVDYTRGSYRTSEIALARELFKNLEEGDLLLADEYFASKEIQAGLRGRGVDYIMPLHHLFKMERHPHRRLGNGEYLVTIRFDEAEQRENPALPGEIGVRVIFGRKTKRNSRRFAVATSLLDRERYPAKEVLGCYARRWGFETRAGEVKTRLHTDRFRSKTVEGAEKELCAHLAAFNLVRLLMLKAARKGGVDPLRISFVSAVRKVLEFSKAMRYAPVQRLFDIYDNLLKSIAADVVPLRPLRREPRALRDAYKRYPAFRCSRGEWRRTGALR